MVEKKQTTFVEMTDETIKKCLSKLTKDSTPSWGMMTAQHMVEHLEFSYRVAGNQLQDFDIATPEKYIDKVAATLWNYEKMPHDYEMPLMKKGMVEDLRHPDFEAAIKKFWEAREVFKDFYKKNPKVKAKSPVFGYLTKYEWYIILNNLVY